jgi:hypothetical protein
MIVRALDPAIRQLGRAEALTPGQQYSVIGIEAGDYRLLNDAGRPYLYPTSAFEIVDPRQPASWITETGEDGEHYAYPRELNAPGFFEDFFDDKPAAVATFWRAVNARLAEPA